VNGSSRVGPRTNIVLSVAILILTGIGWLATDTLPSGLRVDPLGPAYYPRFVLLGLASLALALLVTSLRELVSKNGPLTPGSSLSQRERESVSYRRLAGVMGLALAYVLLLNGLGYFISTGLFVALLLPLLQVRRLPAILGCALGTPLLLSALFGRLLGVPLPGGVLDRLVGVLPA